MDWLKFNGVWIPICPLCWGPLESWIRISGDTWLKCERCEIAFRVRVPKEIRGEPIAFPSRSIHLRKTILERTGAKLISICRRCRYVFINYPRDRCNFCGYRIPPVKLVQEVVAIR